jgi:trigger factor
MMASDENTPTNDATPETGAETSPPAELESGATTAVAEQEKVPQQVEISDAGPCKKHVKVTVDRSIIDARMDAKFSELVRNSPAQVPGFRPGKTPRKIIERKFFKEVAADVKTEILMASLEQLADEQTLSPLSPPELDPNAVLIPESGPMVYEFNIEVRPEFDLPNYKGLKIRKPVHQFSDADVEKELRRILEPYGQIVPKDGSIAEEDLITADVVITDAEGKELNKLSEINVKVEKRLAMADGVGENFAKTLSGAMTGDTRTVDIVLSQEVQNEALRGATVKAAFTIKEVKTVRMPELTKELLSGFGASNADQLNELIRVRLERYMEYLQRQEARKQVLELLAKDAKWELPRDLLLRQARKTLQRRVMEMRNAGMTEEQIVGRQRVLEQDAVRSTASALHEHFVLQKVAEVEKLEIEDDDIDAEIDRIADQTGESPRRVKARMEKDDLIEALATELLERKALDLILAESEYEEYELNPTEADAGEVATSEEQIVPESKNAPTE